MRNILKLISIVFLIASIMACSSDDGGFLDSRSKIVGNWTLLELKLKVINPAIEDTSQAVINTGELCNPKVVFKFQSDGSIKSSSYSIEEDSGGNTICESTRGLTRSGTWDKLSKTQFIIGTVRRGIDTATVEFSNNNEIMVTRKPIDVDGGSATYITTYRRR